MFQKNIQTHHLHAPYLSITTFILLAFFHSCGKNLPNTILFSQDLIEAVVQLQSQLECQGKKQVELEDYLDSLLMKVMAKSPDLLQKDLTMTPASKLTPSIK